MKYVIRLVVFFYFCVNSLYGQRNLVLNPSFEDVNVEALTCDYNQVSENFDNGIQVWKAPSLGTPDILHMSLNQSCSYHPLSTFPTPISSILPRTGNSMVGIVNISHSTTFPFDHEVNRYREYLHGQLSAPLRAGNTYKIKFYVSLSSISPLAVNNFGIKFFSSPFYQNDRFVIHLVPDANYTEVIRLVEDWQLVELEFTPQVSGLTYFVIGNFFSNYDTVVEVMDLGSITVNPFFGENEAYYLIDDVSVERFLPAPIFEAMEAHCQGATFALPLTSENGYTGTWSPAINNQQTTTYTFTPDDPDVESVTATVEILEPSIEPIFTLQTILCEGGKFVFPNQSENGIKGTWSPAFNPKETTTYTFTPEEGVCSLSKTATIEITSTIFPTFDLPSFICKGSSLVLPEVSDNGVQGRWAPAFDNQKTTTYTFIPTNTDCVATFTKTIEVLQVDPILHSYCFQDEFYVEVRHANDADQFQWQVNGSIIQESTALVNLTKYATLLTENTNTLTVQVVNEFGCVATATILVEGKKLCFIPKGISPQGDGLNEAFDISHFGGVSLQIFNRYGMKVYDRKNYRNQWQGQTNSSNALLPSGTYFYHIITNSGEVHTGWVQLVY